jgi:high-affinity Fe2+/Pb2+ permease
MTENTTLESGKKRIFKEVMTIFLIVGAIVAAVIGYGVYWLMYDLDSLPQGEFLKEETSPDGT